MIDNRKRALNAGPRLYQRSLITGCKPSRVPHIKLIPVPSWRNGKRGFCNPDAFVTDFPAVVYDDSNCRVTFGSF